MTTPARLATYDDLLALPEDVKAEVLGGKLVIHECEAPVVVDPVFAHNYAQFGLIAALRGRSRDRCEGSGGWWLLGGIDVHLRDDGIVRPDCVGWRRERLGFPKGQPIDVVPDWIGEVLFPSEVARDRVTKMRLYARHAVPFYWLIDPVACILEAYMLEHDRWVLTGTYGRAAIARSPPFEAIELVVGDLFGPEQPQEG